MIYTVFCSEADPHSHWRDELLAYSWGRVQQAGELVGLLATAPGTRAPRHRHARIVETLSWSPHPYTGDRYPAYNTAASLLEWQAIEHVDGTILLLDPHCIFLSAVTTEIEAGGAQATPWPGLPRGTGPFGLGPDFQFLEDVCVDRSLALSPIKLPVLIHSDDLRKISARWLELTSIIRAETATGKQDPLPDAHRVAYVIAAAEANVPHRVANLRISTDAAETGAPLLDYSPPIESAHGGITWDLNTYCPWDHVDAANATDGAGKSFLTLLEDYVGRRESGGDLAFLRPCRRTGVREGRILDRLFLDIPSRSDTLSLNASAAAVWDLCDGVRSLAEVGHHLEERFGMPVGAVRDDVAAVIDRLQDVGALELKPV